MGFAIAGYNTDIAAIEERTDNLPDYPADELSVQQIKSIVEAISLETALIPADPATETTLAAIEGKIDSLLDSIEIIEDHIHPKETFIYPLTDTITIEKVAASWGAYGAIIELIPANAVAKYFDLHFLNISEISANGTYHIGVYSGLPGAEILEHEYSVRRSTVQSQESVRSIITQLFPPNTRISIALRGSPSNVQSIEVITEGHTY